MVETLLEELSKRNLTLSSAESLTGGLFASTLVDQSGISKVFKGGIVTYWSEIKNQVLHVDEKIIAKFGVVSKECAYAMAKTSYSGEMVRNNRKVILTIPGAEIADAVMGCGSTTGRNTDKVSKFNIELKDVEGSTIQIPAHSRVAIVCSLKEYHEVGDHYLYICDVEQVYGDESEEALFAWNGYSQLRPAK